MADVDTSPIDGGVEKNETDKGDSNVIGADAIRVFGVGGLKDAVSNRLCKATKGYVNFFREV